MRALLNPLRYGTFSFQLLMHKLMRFLTPVFLITGAFALIALAAVGRYQGLFVFAFAATSAALVLGRTSTVGGSNLFRRACNLLYYWLMVNCALVLAWRNVLKRKRMTFWAPERQQG